MNKTSLVIYFWIVFSLYDMQASTTLDDDELQEIDISSIQVLQKKFKHTK